MNGPSSEDVVPGVFRALENGGRKNETGTWLDEGMIDGGISFVLILNVIYAAVCLGIFFMVRKVHTRVYMPLLKTEEERKESRSKDGEYGFADTERFAPESPKPKALWTTQSALEEEARLKLPFGWIWAPLRIPPSKIRSAYGMNAYVLVMFEWFCLLFSIAASILAVAVCLPVNLSGGELDRTAYAHTTVANLPLQSNWYWVHEAMCFVFFILGVGFIYGFFYFVGRLRWKGETVSMPVVRILNIPVTLSEADVFSHLVDAFGADEMVRFDLIRDLRMYAKLMKERLVVSRRLKYFQSSPSLASSTIRTPSGLFGRKVDAATHFGDRLHDIETQLSLLDPPHKARSLGVGFLTFASRRAADGFVEKIKGLKSSGQLEPRVDPTLGVSRWAVKVESILPNDIIWENLCMDRFWHVARRVLVVSLVFSYLFFFTSPAALLASLKQLIHIFHLVPNENSLYWLPLGSLLFSWGPTLLLLYVGLPLPEILRFGAKFERWSSRARHSRSMARKAFLFCFFGFVFFPSIQSISLDAFIEQFINPDRTFWDRVGHVFLADSGSFFINFLIQKSFFELCMTLLNVSTLLEYFFWLIYYRVFNAVSKDEKDHLYLRVEKPMAYVFAYGNLCIVLGLTFIYSAAVPLLPLFSAVYFFNKSCVDRYLILYRSPQVMPDVGTLAPGSQSAFFDLIVVEGATLFLSGCLVFGQILYVSYFAIRGELLFSSFHVIMCLLSIGVAVSCPFIVRKLEKRNSSFLWFPEMGGVSEGEERSVPLVIEGQEQGEMLAVEGDDDESPRAGLASRQGLGFAGLDLSAAPYSWEAQIEKRYGSRAQEYELRTVSFPAKRGASNDDIDSIDGGAQ